jgi:phasin family protein
MGEMKAAAKEMVKSSQMVALTERPKELVEQAVQKALANMRDLAEVVTKTQIETFIIISNRMMQDVEANHTLIQPR